MREGICTIPGQDRAKPGKAAEPCGFCSQHQLLARARVDLGLTQEDAARTLGVDVRTYRRYESGEVNEGGSFALQRASRRKIVDRICSELGIAEDQRLMPLEIEPAPSMGLPRARHFVAREAELTRLNLDARRAREWAGHVAHCPTTPPSPEAAG